MSKKILFYKMMLLGTASLVILSTLSYACGMGGESPSENEGGSAPSAEEGK